MNQKHALVVSEIDFRKWLINSNEPNVGNDNRSENNRQNGSLNVDHPCSDQTRLIASRIEVNVAGQKRTWANESDGISDEQTDG